MIYGENKFVYIYPGLSSLKDNYDHAFVIAGTDIIQSNPVGGLNLTIKDCITRDIRVFEKLSALSIPAVFLGGGGYSKDRVKAITDRLLDLFNS